MLVGVEIDAGGQELPDDLVGALSAFDVWERWRSLDAEDREGATGWVSASKSGRFGRARRVAALLAAGLTPDTATLHRYERAYLRRHPEPIPAPDGQPMAQIPEPEERPPPTNEVRPAPRYGWMAQLDHYESLLPALEAEWAESLEGQDHRRRLIRLWSAGVIGQDALHRRARGPAATVPVALSPASSLEAAWHEIDFFGGVTQTWLSDAIGVGEHVLSVMVGSSQSFWRLGCVVLTKTRLRFIPIHPMLRTWSVPLDDVKAIDVQHRGLGDVGVTIAIEGRDLPENVQCSDEPIVGWRLAFRTRHAVRWRRMRSELQHQLSLDLQQCAADGMLDPSEVATARDILNG